VSDLLRLHVQPDLREAPLVIAFEGWNDAGEAATSALRYLEDAVRGVPLAEIDGEEFYDFTVRRPTARFEGGRSSALDWPTTRFSYGSIDSSRELVTGVGCEPHFHWRRYCDLVAELVARLAVRHVVLLGAFVADVVYSRPVGVTGFASDPGRLAEIGVTPSTYEGPTGIVGALAERLDREDVEVSSLWASLPHYINATPNPRGALALLQKLAQHLEIAVDEAPLRGEAAEFEQRISALVSGDPELGEYVRQLKKREFAQ